MYYNFLHTKENTKKLNIFCVSTHVAGIYANLLEQKKAFA